MGNFWTKAPKIGPHSVGWKPGEKRSYIPVMSFGRPETTPASGVLGKVTNVDGTKTVAFTVNGPKTAGTHKPKGTK